MVIATLFDYQGHATPELLCGLLPLSNTVLGLLATPQSRVQVAIRVEIGEIDNWGGELKRRLSLTLEELTLKGGRDQAHNALEWCSSWPTISGIQLMTAAGSARIAVIK